LSLYLSLFFVPVLCRLRFRSTAACFLLLNPVHFVNPVLVVA
jgi:hypothetical protein